MENNALLRKIYSWDDLKAKLKDLDAKHKGDVFEYLTKYFLQIDPVYRTKLKEVWLFNEVPEKIRQYLKLPVGDQGIDLIAETKAGEYWAIQCKYRDDEKSSLTWREVSTFAGLAFGICQNISFGLICSTTERFTNVLKEQENISFCSSDVWNALQSDFFDRLHALISTNTAPLKPYKPRKHQEQAIAAATSYYSDQGNTRGKMIMPCGTGKSLTAYWIAEALGAKKILIAVPSLALVKQTLEIWLREKIASKADVNWVCICSDTSAGNIEADDVVVHTQDLGVPCLTKIDEIRDWFRHNNQKTQIIFTTYQSGKVIAEASKKLGVVYDLGIMDEAHKTVGGKDKLFAHLLDDQNIQIKKRLFMTATERRYQGDSDEIVSMDNPEIYGGDFYVMPFKEALSASPQILSDYRIITVTVSKSETTELIKNKAFVEMQGDAEGKVVTADTLASVVALRKAIKKYPINHTVSFHSSIKRAKVFKECQDVFSKISGDQKQLSTFHVSGGMPAGVRHRAIQEFVKSDSSLITNARCLTEGVDVPSLDCVLFSDPKGSKIDIVQAVGRILRPQGIDKYGYIIIPVLVDETEEPGAVIESSAFYPVLAVLRALASNDDRIIDYFRAVSEGTEAKSSKFFNIDISPVLASKIDLRELDKAIELKCWNRLAKLSWRPFSEARDFIRSLKLKSRSDWGRYCESELPAAGDKPEDVPTAPSIVYASKGWVGWGDWLGTETVAPWLRKYRSFEEAREFAHNLELRSKSEWVKYCKGV